MIIGSGIFDFGSGIFDFDSVNYARLSEAFKPGCQWHFQVYFSYSIKGSVAGPVGVDPGPDPDSILQKNLDMNAEIKKKPGSIHEKKHPVSDFDQITFTLNFFLNI